MFHSTINRYKALGLLLCLFFVSLICRRPLFDHELTNSHEWLAAHTLITVQLWHEVPRAVHHFNLLYTFTSPADKFVDDLWSAGVVDAKGNFYYVSMPHFAFASPYLFFKALKQKPSIASLQMFCLVVHFLVCSSLYLLTRYLTKGAAGSRLSSGVAFCMFLFAPTALFYYQNAYVGTVMVILYTVVVLGSVTIFIEDKVGRLFHFVAGASTFLAIALGCLTDWQGYFTALAAISVILALGIRREIPFRTATVIISLCCLGVLLASLVIGVQDASIAGWDTFTKVIIGRFKVRVGVQGLSVLSAGYYGRLLRFYAAYLPFLLPTAGFLWIAFRRRREAVENLLKRSRVPLAISILAVGMDHVALANHTAMHSFTTLNTLVPMSIIASIAVASFLETSRAQRRGSMVVCFAVALGILVSVCEYFYAYQNRPHPYRASADAIKSVAAASDVIFAEGRSFESPSDAVPPQLLYYLRRNVRVVSGATEAREYLALHRFRRGVLANFNRDFSLAGIEVLQNAAALEAQTARNGQ